MFLLKLFVKAAISLAILGAVVGIIGASGCGQYIPHEPEKPDIEIPDEKPGTDGSEDNENPEDPETTDQDKPEENAYVNTSLTVYDTLSGTFYFEYTGELNSVHVTATNVPDSAIIMINQPGIGNYAFTVGPAYKMTVVNGNAPSDWACWFAQMQRPLDTFTLTDGSAEFTLTVPATYLYASLGNSGNTVDLDFSLTLTTT